MKFYNQVFVHLKSGDGFLVQFGEAVPIEQAHSIVDLDGQTGVLRLENKIMPMSSVLYLEFS